MVSIEHCDNPDMVSIVTLTFVPRDRNWAYLRSAFATAERLPAVLRYVGMGCLGWGGQKVIDLSGTIRECGLCLKQLRSLLDDYPF
jgi:hypothetical protein